MIQETIFSCYKSERANSDTSSIHENENLSSQAGLLSFFCLVVLVPDLIDIFDLIEPFDLIDALDLALDGLDLRPGIDVLDFALEGLERWDCPVLRIPFI